MAKRNTRALRWAAPIALVGALGVAACGADDADTTEAAAPRPVAVADNHLDIRAAEISQERRSERAASARLTAQAEQYERAAHLEGQAKTYGSDVPTNSDANIPEGNPFGDEFLPGSRHVPVR
jgi:hypothetical protein